jgi:hypothetical protein
MTVYCGEHSGVPSLSGQPCRISVRLRSLKSKTIWPNYSKVTEHTRRAVMFACIGRLTASPLDGEGPCRAQFLFFGFDNPLGGPIEDRKTLTVRRQIEMVWV